MEIRQVHGWVGAGLADAVSRFVILSGVTAFCARLLSPSDFGTSALVLSVVTVLSVCVGAPYEETLAQRRRVRCIHVQASLAASLAVGILCVGLSAALGRGLDLWWGGGDFALMLPACAGLLLAQGPLSIATAVARRRRQFYAINVASLAGHAVGAGLAVLLGLAGAGIWTLIGFRIAIVFAAAACLLAMVRMPLRPRWCWPVIADLNRFAVFVLLTRVVENLSFLVYNFTVGGLFGVAVLGQANMAMRLIEPIRGAVIAILHNLSVSFLKGLADDRPRFGTQVLRISAETNVLTAPVFMGLAAVSPVLVPLLAGPGWEEAVPITVMLAAGGMLALPALVVMSALSVVGLPKLCVYGNGVGLAALVLVLVPSSGLEPVFVGVARAAGDAGLFLFLVLVGGPLVLLRRRALLAQLAGPWLSALLMALAVTLILRGLGSRMPAVPLLCLAVPSGIAAYALLLFVLARPRFERLLQLLPRRRPLATATPEPAE